MTAIVNVRLFGTQEISIYDEKEDKIVETRLVTSIKNIDEQVNMILAKYQISEVVLYGAKVFTKKIGSYITEKALTAYGKNDIKITYKEH